MKMYCLMSILLALSVAERALQKNSTYFLFFAWPLHVSSSLHNGKYLSWHQAAVLDCLVKLGTG